MSMREFALIDYPFFLLNAKQEIACLDAETSVLHQQHSKSSVFLQNSIFSRDHFLSLAVGALHSPIYLQIRKSGACASLVFLKPAEALQDAFGSWEEVCTYLGESGVRHILAHTQDQEQVIDGLELHGFNLYGNFHVWKTNQKPQSVTVQRDPWQRVPASQTAEVQVFLDHFLPATNKVLLEHQLERGRVFIFKEKMDVQGFAQVFSNHGNALVWLVLDERAVDAPAAVQCLLQRIQHHAAAVCIGMYDFQLHNMSMIEGFCEPESKQFQAFVKHLVRFQKSTVPALQRVRKKPSKTEWSAPISHIQKQ